MEQACFQQRISVYQFPQVSKTVPSHKLLRLGNQGSISHLQHDWTSSSGCLWPYLYQILGRTPLSGDATMRDGPCLSLAVLQTEESYHIKHL